MKANPYSLDQLHDIVEPAAVSWWPPAAGMYLLLALVLVWLIAALLLTWQRHRHNAYRREGLALLQQIAPGLHAPENRGVALQELGELLKRVALNAFPREEVAALSGADWLAFLDRTAGGSAFVSGPASIIATAAYQTRNRSDLAAMEQDEIITAVRRWILHHQPVGQA